MRQGRKGRLPTIRRGSQRGLKTARSETKSTEPCPTTDPREAKTGNPPKRKPHKKAKNSSPRGGCFAFGLFRSPVRPSVASHCSSVPVSPVAPAFFFFSSSGVSPRPHSRRLFYSPPISASRKTAPAPFHRLLRVQKKSHPTSHPHFIDRPPDYRPRPFSFSPVSVFRPRAHLRPAQKPPPAPALLCAPPLPGFFSIEPTRLAGRPSAPALLCAPPLSGFFSIEPTRLAGRPSAPGFALRLAAARLL